jgi:hypothetical protein
MPKMRSGARAREDRDDAEPIHGTHVQQSPLIKDEPRCAAGTGRINLASISFLISFKDAGGIEPAMNCFAGSRHVVWPQRQSAARGLSGRRWSSVSKSSGRG